MTKINSKGNLLMCAAELLIGILLLIDPVGFTSGIIIVLGVCLTILGIFSLINYFRVSPEKAAAQSGLAKGLIFCIIGLFCAFKSSWFIVTFPLLTVLYGIMTLLGGIHKIQWAVDMLRMKYKYWFIAIISAGLSIAFAVLILANPFATTAVLWTFIAVTLIVEAVVDIIAVIFGKKSPKTDE